MPSTPSRRPAVLRILTTTIAAASLLAGVALAAPAQAAPTTFTLSGTVSYQQSGGVTDTNGQSDVRAVSLTGNAGAKPASYSVHSTGGTWSISGLPAGRYRVQFGADSFVDAAHAPTWLGNTPYEDSAQVVTVAANVSGLAVTRPAAGSISGTVTGLPAGASVSGFSAYLLNQTTGLFERQAATATASGAAGGYTIAGLNPGAYVVRFADRSTSQPAYSTQYFQNSTDLWHSQPVTITAAQSVSGINGTVGRWTWYSGRIAGADRFQTAVQVSRSFYDPGTARAVYVANGMAFADALSASAAAARAGGPLLMVSQNGIPTPVLAEIKRLKAQHIVVVGGPATVSPGVYAQLAKLVPSSKNIVRLSGSDRYSTSRAVATSLIPGGTTRLFPPAHLDSVFIATGATFPDALVAGSAAGYQGAPLLLVPGKASSLDKTTATLLKSLAPLRGYVVGGPVSVSPGIEAQFATLGIPTVLRLGGSDRFGTAQAVNTEVFPFADEVFVATAYNYADALSISAVAGVVGAPLLLSPPQCLPSAAVSHATLMGVSTYWVVGGTKVLSPDVQKLRLCAPGKYTLSATTVEAAPSDVSTLQKAMEAAHTTRANRR